MYLLVVNYFVSKYVVSLFRHISITHNKIFGKVTDYYTINKELKT